MEARTEAQNRDLEIGTEAEIMEKGPYLLAQLITYLHKHGHRSIQMKVISQLWLPLPRLSNCQLKLTMTRFQQNTTRGKIETLIIFRIFTPKLGIDNAT